MRKGMKMNTSYALANNYSPQIDSSFHGRIIILSYPEIG